MGIKMSDEKPNSTDKIILPKSLQREMIKFFAQASLSRNALDDEDKQQTPENPKKGVLSVDKHWNLCQSFDRGAGT